ncbi:PH domain-containing protein [Bacteroides sp. GD17]|jgi:uncharacterized membrane protein YdbT with pleckstrin-like domain|uniref:PH domain-containing protein n=1 Tax=Bacteroides sp. GD17 TaxID=3139826 RepID=UPI00313EA34C
MSYIQDNLQAGEEIKYKANIHWYIFVYPVILLLLGACLSSARTSFIYYIGLLLLILGLFQLVKRVFIKLGAEYVITNKKVILKSGFLSRDALELILNKCEGLRINQSIMGRILGFGSIVVTTGGATNTFNYITNPMKFRNEINAQLQ